ncbi:MAG TPA: FkbM family methyltransferase [Thermoanaerobaculia bacterium]|nr:FkbM family methyltransferase [Thermoanaerobaculia bacterium]
MRVELLDAVSKVKWAVYPWVVRFSPRLAIAIHESKSAGAWWRAIDEGMIVVDGGANLGGYTMLASKRAGAAGRIFAFEPEPGNFAKLLRRVHGLRNVIPVQKALGRRSGEAQLHLDRFHARHSLTRDGSHTITVPVTTLDDFVRDEKLEGVDVLKLDIEGAELEAIAGMSGTLTAPRRPVVLCELHPPHAPEQFRDALAVHGYRSELLDARFTGAVHHAPVHILATPA